MEQSKLAWLDRFVERNMNFWVGEPLPDGSPPQFKHRLGDMVFSTKEGALFYQENLQKLHGKVFGVYSVYCFTPENPTVAT